MREVDFIRGYSTTLRIRIKSICRAFLESHILERASAIPSCRTDIACRTCPEPVKPRFALRALTNPNRRRDFCYSGIRNTKITTLRRSEKLSAQLPGSSFRQEGCRIGRAFHPALQANLRYGWLPQNVAGEWSK